MAWFWWAPLLAVALHIVEEFVYPGGFGAWDRDYRPQIRSSITPRLHFIVNALLLGLCLSVGLAGMSASGAAVGHLRVRSAIPPEHAAAAWLALAALLASNALFHMLGTFQMRRYAPGTVTGVFLYLPMAAFGYWLLLTSGRASGVTAVLSAALGGSYHLWASIGHRLRATRRAE